MLGPSFDQTLVESFPKRTRIREFNWEAVLTLGSTSEQDDGLKS